MECEGNWTADGNDKQGAPDRTIYLQSTAGMLTRRSPCEAPRFGNTLCSKSRGELGLQTMGCESTVEKGVRSTSLRLLGNTESLLPSSALRGTCLSNSSGASLP